MKCFTAEMLAKDEPEFLRVLEGRAKDNGKLKIIDISKKEKEVEVKELKTLDTIIEEAKADFPGLQLIRVPVCNSAAPNEVDFDTICQALVGSNINTPVIVNDQVGLSRATTGCTISCLFKEFQINASFEGLVETVPGVNLDLLKMDRYIDNEIIVHFHYITITLVSHYIMKVQHGLKEGPALQRRVRGCKGARQHSHRRNCSKE